MPETAPPLHPPIQSYRKLFQPLLPWTFTLLLLWIALALIPLPPQIPGIGLDSSWAYGLNIAHVENFIFGRDVLFTFGPLGYLFYPDTARVAAFLPFALTWAVYGLFLFGLLLVWRSLGHRLMVLVTWGVLAGAMLLTTLPFERMQLSFLTLALAIVALLVSRGNAPTAYLATAGAVAGLIPLFKVNEGIAASAVFYTLLVSLLLSTSANRQLVWRKVWALALVPPLVFGLGFVLLERNVSALWSFVASSLQLAMGYSEAMGHPGPLYQAILALLSLAILGFFIPVFARSRRDLIPGYLPALLIGFFAFKSGLVRQDDSHADVLQIKFAVAALFLLICARNLRDRRLLMACAMTSFLLGAAAFRQANAADSRQAIARATLHDTSMNLSAARHISSTWVQLGEQTRQQLDKIRLDAEISNLVSAGTVDDVPYELDLLESNGWRWAPRPVIQSYSAYTPALDQLNARHLASPQSADHILMQWEDIDDRHPLLDDAASWRSLFDHYDVQLTRPDLLVLQRRLSPRYLDPRPIASFTAQWHSDIALPQPTANAFLMMRAEIDRNYYGILRGILFRNSVTYLNATYASGTQSRLRIIRANLVDGALVGYLPKTLTEALPYFGQLPDSSPGNLPEPVVSIRFETAGPREYSPNIRISWYSVAFRPDSTPQPVVTVVEPVPATGALTRRLNQHTQGFIDYVNGRPFSPGHIQASSEGLITITGWAIDAPAHQLASAVNIDLDGQLFPAAYGLRRPDVSESLKEPAYEKSGFRGQIRAHPGTHKVSLRILNAAGTAYYAGPSFSLATGRP